MAKIGVSASTSTSMDGGKTRTRCFHPAITFACSSSLPMDWRTEFPADLRILSKRTHTAGSPDRCDAKRQSSFHSTFRLRPTFTHAEIRSEEHQSELQSLMRITFTITAFNQKQ